jgi:hypothetical protein
VESSAWRRFAPAASGWGCGFGAASAISKSCRVLCVRWGLHCNPLLFTHKKKETTVINVVMLGNYQNTLAANAYFLLPDKRV